MVMLTYTIDEMNKLLGKKLSEEKYENIAFKYGLDLEVGESALNFELTSDRTDIVSKYSLACIFASELGIKLKRDISIKTENPGIFVEKTGRPFVNLLHVSLNGQLGDNLDEVIKIQERLDKNVGRNRKKAAIGLFDYGKINFPIKYHEEIGDNITFVPLGYSTKKNYKDIIGEIKQGHEYGDLLPEKPVVWSDKTGSIIALPPIINSDYHSINKTTNELLVDVTGNDPVTVNTVTKILAYNLQFLGHVSLLKVNYSSKSISTNISFDTHAFSLNEDTVESLLGLRVNKGEIKNILSKMDYFVRENSKDLVVKPPFYRQDVMHQVDIIDDIMRCIGIDKIPKIPPNFYTEGGFLKNHYTLNNIREILVGFGYQEIDVNVLTNEKYQFENTFLKGKQYVSLLHLKSGDVTMTSKNVFPELLRLVSNNLHKKFPQNLFSLSEITEKGDSDTVFENRTKLCVLSCGKDVNVTYLLSIIKKVLGDSLLIKDISAGYSGQEFSMTFIPGRGYNIYFGEKTIGIAGELHPRVINSFGIELPVTFAEIYIDELSA
jgi:phenylalanyl-tRNA synthetase beta chain